MDRNRLHLQSSVLALILLNPSTLLPTVAIATVATTDHGAVEPMTTAEVNNPTSPC